MYKYDISLLLMILRKSQLLRVISYIGYITFRYIATHKLLSFIPLCFTLRRRLEVCNAMPKPPTLGPRLRGSLELSFYICTCLPLSLYVAVATWPGHLARLVTYVAIFVSAN